MSQVRCCILMRSIISAVVALGFIVNPAFPQSSPPNKSARLDPVRYVQEIRAAAERMLVKHPSLVGRAVTFDWRPLPAQARICRRSVDLVLPQSTRLWGEVAIVVRCADRPGWVASWVVDVRVSGSYWVLKVPKPAASIFGPGDAQEVSSDLSRLKPGAFEQLVDDPKRISGYSAARPLLVGDPLLLNDWRPVAVVKAGDRVKVAVTGAGFELSSEGQAIESGKVGDRVRVRLDDGRMVTGVATALGAVAVQLE